MPGLDYTIQGGRLDQRLTIQVPNTAQDGVGNVNPWPDGYEPPTFRRCYGSVLPGAGTEQLMSERIAAVSYGTIVIRYRRPLPTTLMRVLHERTGDLWEIQGVSDVETKRKKIELTVRIVE